MDVLAMYIVDNENLVVSKPYRASVSERYTLSRIIQEWKEVGIFTKIKPAYIYRLYY